MPNVKILSEIEGGSQAWWLSPLNPSTYGFWRMAEIGKYEFQRLSGLQSEFKTSVLNLVFVSK